jgi:hypothetical protein
MRTRHLALCLATSLLAAGGAAATETEQSATPPAKAQEMAPQQTAPTPSTTPSGSVDRSALTSAIIEREPQDDLREVGIDQGKIFYFTEVHDMPGGTVVHRWEHGGEVVAEVPFEIGGTRWRTYSSKDLMPGWTGAWTVSTLDPAGRVLDTQSFTVVEARNDTSAVADTREETLPPAAPAD